MVKSIVLVGMMGSGKSSIGRILAKELKIPFVDTDQLIEKTYKKKISNIFKIHGEAFFRRLEYKTCSAVLKAHDAKVISIGGGAFINPKIRNLIKSKAISIWFNVSLNNLYLRLKKSKNKRPLLDYANLKNSILKTLNHRKKYYRLANLCINIKDENPKQLVKLILNKYEKITS